MYPRPNTPQTDQGLAALEKSLERLVSHDMTVKAAHEVHRHGDCDYQTFLKIAVVALAGQRDDAQVRLVEALRWSVKPFTLPGWRG